MARLVPGQSYQWRQGAQAWDPARSESGGHRFATGCLEPHPKQERTGRKVSSLAIQTWRTQSDHSNGAHSSSTGLSHAQVRSPLRGSGNRVLRSQIPTAATTLDSQAGGSPQHATHSTSRLRRLSFWRVADKPSEGVTVVRS